MDSTATHLTTPQVQRITLGNVDTTFSSSHSSNIIPARGDTTFRRTIGSSENIPHSRSASDLTTSNFLRPNCATTMSTSLPYFPKPTPILHYSGAKNDLYHRDPPQVISSLTNAREIYHRDPVPTTLTTTLSEYETHVSHPAQESTTTLPVSSHYYEQPGVPQVSTTVYKADAKGRWTVQEIPGGLNVPPVLTTGIHKQPVSTSFQHTSLPSVTQPRTIHSTVTPSGSTSGPYPSTATLPTTVTLGSVGPTPKASSKSATTIYSTSTLTQDPQPVVSREDTFVNTGDSTKPAVNSSFWTTPPSIRLSDRGLATPTAAEYYHSTSSHNRGMSTYPLDGSKNLLLSRSDLSGSTFDMQNGQYASTTADTYSSEISTLKRELEKVQFQLEHTTKTLDVFCDVLASWLKGLPSKDARLLVNDLLALLGGHCQPDTPEFEAVRARLDLCSRMM